MDGNGSKSCQQSLKAAIGKLTRRKARHEIGEAACSIHWHSLSKEGAVRLARHILAANQHLGEFEVAFGDEDTCIEVANVLEATGCSVMRVPFKWLLIVRCPFERAA